MNKAKKISIIVIVYNAEKTIKECLESLVHLRFPGSKFEIIVVDNASTDSTPAIIRSFPVTYVYEARRNRASARNAGIRSASGDIIAFIDADCVAHPDWLERLVAKFDTDDKIGGVAGALLSEPQSLVEKYIAYRRIVDQEKMLDKGRCCSPPFALTANLAIRRKVLDTIGLFDDENLPITGEDADLCWRMQWAGFRLVYEPHAIVWHKHRSSIRQLFLQTYGYGFSNVSLFAKHHKKFHRRIWVDVRFYIWLFKSLLKIPYAQIFVRNEFERAVPVFDFIANLGIILGKIHGSIYHKRLVI
ncbi:glycosyltransferase [Candidatus Sumerlaeota bacterium]|nr:glycosyltransferase [Candidatus Sumerlaeota bacterium]